ncbi:MAG: hypothetical protein KDB00_10145 [Planctomycetales bacterium]|nr:hypothetical protein [Planctomycetales bacterium]
MRTKIFGGLVCLVAVAFIGLPAFAADDDDSKPKLTIKKVMGQAFKGKDPLVKKVAGGGASAEEAKKLHEMLVALSKNESPRADEEGNKESWKKMTAALVKASKGVVDGDEGAGEALSKAANCAACHKAHKPK